MNATSPRCFLNTYKPLVWTAFGRRAAAAHGLPPFVDGSIRREPDLEHPHPAITCLCRTHRFAPRLLVGDVVGYMTTKRMYGDVGFRHNRLTAVLRMKQVFQSHTDAAAWYSEQGFPLPSNLMVSGNSAEPMQHSHCLYAGKVSDCGPKNGCGKSDHAAWDAQYRQRAKAFGTVVVCDSMFCNLSWSAPVVTDDKLTMAFGRLPGTRNPGTLPVVQFAKLMKILKIDVPLSVR